MPKAPKLSNHCLYILRRLSAENPETGLAITLSCTWRHWDNGYHCDFDGPRSEWLLMDRVEHRDVKRLVALGMLQRVTISGRNSSSNDYRISDAGRAIDTASVPEDYKTPHEARRLQSQARDRARNQERRELAIARNLQGEIEQAERKVLAAVEVLVDSACSGEGHAARLMSQLYHAQAELTAVRSRGDKSS